MSLFAQVCAVTGGVGALVASGFLVREAFTPGHRTRRTSILIGVYAFVALAGSLGFCHDLLAHRELWREESTILALFNFLGVIMMNSFALTLVAIGGACLYLSRPATVPGKEQRQDPAGPTD